MKLTYIIIIRSKYLRLGPCEVTIVLKIAEKHQAVM